MAEIQEVMAAERAASDAIDSTEATMGRLEDVEVGAGAQYDAIVVAQSNLAVARAIQALAVRIDFVAYDVLARARR